MILKKGHTQMKCDSVHNTIERKLRKKPVYSPQTKVHCMRSARQEQP